MAAQENDAETETCYVSLCVCVVFHVLPDQGRLEDVYIYIFVVGGGDGLLLRFSLHFSRLIFGLLFGSFLKYSPAKV